MNLTSSLDEIASIETMCVSRVSQHGSEEIIEASESPPWLLGDMGKLNS